MNEWQWIFEIWILLIANVSIRELIFSVKTCRLNSVIWGKCVCYHQQGHNRKYDLRSQNQVVHEDVCPKTSNEWLTRLHAWLCCRESTDSTRTASQRLKEVCERLVPRVRVVQVTGVARPFHHHHSVIGQVAQVSEWLFSELRVLITVNDQRWDLEERRDTRNTHGSSWWIIFSPSSLLL